MKAANNRELENQLSLLVDSRIVGFFSVVKLPDGTRKLNYASPKFMEIVGLTLEELSSPTDLVAEQIHPDDLARVTAANRLAVDQETEWHEEFRLVRKDGSVKEIDGYGRPDKLADGSVLWKGMFIDVSGRMEADRLKNEKSVLDERLNNIVELTPGGLYNVETNSNGKVRLVYASPKYLEMLGLSLEEAKDDPFVINELIHPQDRQRIDYANQVAHLKFTPFHEEFRMIRKDGSEMEIEVVSHPHKEKNGSILWYGIMFDVTERKRNERVAKEKMALEQHLAQIARLSPEGIYTMRLHLDKSSEIVYTSQKFLSLVGLTVDNMGVDASRFERMIHPEDAYDFHVASKRAFTTLSEWHKEFRFIRPDGKEIWLESYSNHVKEPDGSILRYAILMDITNRKNLENARKLVHVQLLESEAKYRMLADNIEVPMVVVDGEGKVVLINESAVKIFGGKQSDLIGKNLNESKVPVILSSRKLVIETVLVENRKVEDEISMNVNGEKHWFRRKFQPISINGKPSEVLITGLDITAEKTEIEIRKNYAADLEWKMKSANDELLSELRRVKDSKN